jgi:hypothetical protein
MKLELDSERYYDIFVRNSASITGIDVISPIRLDGIYDYTFIVTFNTIEDMLIFKLKWEI